MVFLIAATTGACVAFFTLGWMRGYTKACSVHGWNLPQIDWRNYADRSRSF